MTRPKTKFFRVEAELKKGITGYLDEYTYAFDIESTSKAEAHKTFKEKWAADPYLRKHHPFHLRSRMLKPTEEVIFNYFRLIGAEINL